MRPDAIISLAQSLTEALNQLASGLRRACDLIEELGRRKDFYRRQRGGDRTGWLAWSDSNYGIRQD